MLLNIISFIGGLSFFVLIYFWIRAFKNRKKNVELSKKMKKYRNWSLIVFIASLIIYAPLYQGSSQQKSDDRQAKEDSISQAKSDSESSKKSSESSAKASSESSSKAESNKESSKEAADESSAKKSNAKKAVSDYKKKLAESANDSKGAIESATYDNDGTTTLVVSEDVAMSDNVKELCYQLWRVTMNTANSYNIDPSWVTIQDDGGSQIAHTSTFTGKFVFDGD